MRTIGLDVDTLKVLFDGHWATGHLPHTDTHDPVWRGDPPGVGFSLVLMKMKMPQWLVIKAISGHTTVTDPNGRIKMSFGKAIDPVDADRLTDILNSLQETADGPG
jgi:hypothetical protein